MEENGNFVCSTKDCNLRFLNETHLKNHKKKHEMVLSLSKTTVNSCDETPTPNTFIRDCEEVGLFQDLRNVNPFEESFCKAAEAARTGAHPPSSLSFSCHGADDTLHTPHVFPAEPEQLLQSRGNLLSQESCKNVNGEKVVRREADTSRKVPSPIVQGIITNAGSGGNVILIDKERTINSTTNSSNNNTLLISSNVSNRGSSANSMGGEILDCSQHSNVQVLLRVPEGTVLQLVQTPSTTTVGESVLSAVQGEGGGGVVVGGGGAEVARPPRTVILNTQSILQPPPPQPLPIVPGPNRQPNKSSLVKQKLKAALLNARMPFTRNSEYVTKLPYQFGNEGSVRVNGGVGIGGDGRSPRGVKRSESAASSSTNSEEDPQEEKRRKALERNRAAAMRCREKRRMFVAELGKKANAMMATNQALVQEVACLRAEVTRLKTLLLAHSNCPVTLANRCAVREKNGSETLVIVQGSHCVTDESTLILGGHIIEEGMVEGDGDEGERAKGKGARRGGLSLDIEGARRGSLPSNDPDSPLVRSDKVLSSVAPPTPNEHDKIIAFNNNGDDSDVEVLEERPLATPVIQLNPNAVLRASTTSQGFS